ncbi:MAG TPA: beta-propeller fold lactonase family protein, partial [Flavisolibacter sp.]|nr:beta-propeller fold lactonase family protein [Flavisolibacter sp.]
MRKIYMSLFFVVTTIMLQAQAYKLPGKDKNQVLLPNGWSLSPAGRSLSLGDLPLNMAVSSSGRWIAVTNNGQSTQSIQLIDARREKVMDSIDIPESWYGLRFSKDEKYLYASGGNDNIIWKYQVSNNKLKVVDSILLGKPWPEKISPAGIELDDSKQTMYVVTKENNSLYIIDLKTKSIKGNIKLGGEAYSCLLSPDKKTLYISCWGCDKIIVFDTETNKVRSEIAVGDNPNEMCLSKNGKWLFVANANDNSVSIISLTDQKQIETLNAALYPDAPSGSTTNGIALSPDDKILYIANADNNCLAVFDDSQPGQSHSKGFIPVGWYPTNVKVIGKEIWVTNGKGFTSMANPFGP